MVQVELLLLSKTEGGVVKANSGSLKGEVTTFGVVGRSHQFEACLFFESMLTLFFSK